ncbi:hypothetical protein [Pseudomonas sp.]|uniref:hypothetical protein n=1 Tax=Pseudomonas sp. TaxID=306 RepID=UPI003F33F0DC
MKLHIENLHVTVHASPQQPAGLLATLAIANAASSIGSQAAPQIGEKWPGTEATYAGVSLSTTGDRLVHLLLWDEDDSTAMDHADAVKHAESVNPAMASHLPTRHQAITLFDNLQDCFNKDYWHWTLTKTKSGKAAFFQLFLNGYQGGLGLSAECRVRAVSEIPL